MEQKRQDLTPTFFSTPLALLPLDLPPRPHRRVPPAAASRPARICRLPSLFGFVVSTAVRLDKSWRGACRAVTPALGVERRAGTSRLRVCPRHQRSLQVAPGAPPHLAADQHAHQPRRIFQKTLRGSSRPSVPSGSGLLCLGGSGQWDTCPLGTSVFARVWFCWRVESSIVSPSEVTVEGVVQM